VGVKGWGNLWEAASIYMKGWKQPGHPQQLQLWGVKCLHLQAPMCIPKHTELWCSLPSQITLISPHGVKCFCWGYFCFPQQDKRMLKVQTIMHQVGERESHPDCVGIQIVENGFVQFSLV
jgi:hypothetical protein